jgi:putative proteasome-type protease
MTFCIATRVAGGLVALADTRIAKGSDILSKTKLASHSVSGHAFFTMTSGLRSIRDKALIYLEDHVAHSAAPPRRLYELANAFGEQLRRVRREDGDALQKSNLAFNLHAIIGGRLGDDQSPTLFLVYPEGNWIEVNDESPFFAIGRTPYGVPLIAKHITKSTPLNEAAAWALVAFDMTASSVSDVDYPIDIAILQNTDTGLRRHRYEREDLKPLLDRWHASLHQQLQELPSTWLGPLLSPQP